MTSVLSAVLKGSPCPRSPLGARGTPTTTTLAFVVGAAFLLVLDAVRNVSLLAAVAAGVDIPAAVVISQVALGVVELAVAAGAWGLHYGARTGARTVAALSLVLATVGVLHVPSPGGKPVEAVGALLCLGVLAVSLHPDTPRAYP